MITLNSQVSERMSCSRQNNSCVLKITISDCCGDKHKTVMYERS